MAQQYGKNMVLVRIRNGQTRDEIISTYNEFVVGTQQKTNESMDREFLNEITDGQFLAAVKQYVDKGDLTCINGNLYKIVWISKVMTWC